MRLIATSATVFIVFFNLVGVVRADFVGPLFHEATNEFASLKTTFYQHKTQVDRSEGEYRYDCVGFVSYALQQAAPHAWESVAQATGISKKHIPSPARYRKFFASLAEKPQHGWKAISKASELRPGDVVAWEHKTETATGHAVIIGGIPEAMTNGSWRVEIYDSTSSPHDNDSRPHDPRALILPTTERHSGLGHGIIILLTNGADGTITGIRWNSKSKPLTLPIAAGRPLN